MAGGELVPRQVLDLHAQEQFVAFPVALHAEAGGALQLLPALLDHGLKLARVGVRGEGIRVGREQREHEGVAAGELVPPERLAWLEPGRTSSDLDGFIQARQVAILAMFALPGEVAVAPFDAAPARGIRR